MPRLPAASFVASELRFTDANCYRRSPVKRILAAVAFVVAACHSESVGPKPTVAAPPPSFFINNPHFHVMLPLGHVRPSGAPSRSSTVDNGIYYHGGPVILAQQVAAIYWSSKTIYSGGPAPGTPRPRSPHGPVTGHFPTNPPRSP